MTINSPKYEPRMNSLQIGIHFTSNLLLKKTSKVRKQSKTFPHQIIKKRKKKTWTKLEVKIDPWNYNSGVMTQSESCSMHLNLHLKTGPKKLFVLINLKNMTMIRGVLFKSLYILMHPAQNHIEPPGPTKLNNPKVVPTTPNLNFDSVLIGL